MPDLALAAAGVIVFGLTTWASLVFGYGIFQNMFEEDQAVDPVPTGLPIENSATPLLAVHSADEGIAGPAEVVPPVIPTA